MDARSYWREYVDRCGGIKAAADRLGAAYSTVAGICNGSRGIGRDLATRFAKADESLDATVLVWVQPVSEGNESIAPASAEKVA